MSSKTLIMTCGQRGLRMRWLSSCFAVAYALCCVAAFSHDQIPGEKQTRPIVIRNATLHVIDGPQVERGDLLFEDGTITALGPNLKVPNGTEEFDASGKHVYPGLIEAMTDLGLREISAVEETDDRTEYGDQNPNVRAWVAVNPDSELIPVARAGGVLTVMTAPRGRFLRGQSAVLYLDGWTASEMALKTPGGLYVDWEPSSRGTIATLMRGSDARTSCVTSMSCLLRRSDTARHGRRDRLRRRQTCDWRACCR